MPQFDLATYVARTSQLISEALNRFTPDETMPPPRLQAAIRYSLLGNGKLIRPLLCVASAQAVGGRAEDVLPMACALEMVHTFSLMHDDLPALDNDDFRRGVPTSHKQFGEAMAILAGDALNTLAYATIATHQLPLTSDPARVVRVIRLLADASGTLGMVGGQVDDMAYERMPVSAEILRSIHERKTGALLNASILSGAILAGATDAQEDALRAYGNQVGLAFQIVDDILDVVGDDAKIGKPTGSDVKNDKATYPKMYGLSHSEALAREAADTAIAALSGFDDQASPLRAFARYIVERDM